MKKNKSLENVGAKKKETITITPLGSIKKIKKGGANSNFPLEHEEQRSLDIRMKPQPFDQARKRSRLNDDEK